MIILNAGVTAPRGFQANGISCGIKRSGKRDLALIFSEVPATCVGVFTKNSIVAAPVVVTKEKLCHNHRAQAVIINSGNANCFTGNFGLLYARRTTELMARLLNIPASEVLVASTGIIGKPLPYLKIQNAAAVLVKGLGKNGSRKAAQAILTTDLKTKESGVAIKLAGKKVILGAMAKGSGMIAPNMATMLAFINTDAAIDAGILKLALTNATTKSFNSISVDGCMSTNDMVIVMANGLAGNKLITKEGKDFKIFSQALNYICLDLAKKIVLDAEGATKFIEIRVEGAKDEAQARKVGMAIANSNLFKTAAFGGEPNWGRVAAAVGSLALNVSEKQLKIKFSPFTKKKIDINVDVNLGTASATVYTCDLSLDYVRINGRYH